MAPPQPRHHTEDLPIVFECLLEHPTQAAESHGLKLVIQDGFIRIRLTRELQVAIDRIAQAEEMTLSQYVRRELKRAVYRDQGQLLIEAMLKKILEEASQGEGRSPAEEEDQDGRP